MTPNLENALLEALIEQQTQYEIALDKMELACTELQQSGVDLCPAIRALSTTLGLMIAALPVTIQPLVQQSVMGTIEMSIEFGNKEDEE